MHPALRACAEQQLGLFTAADARKAGYEHPEIRHLCTSGTWVRLRRGVYVTATELADIEQRGRRHRVDCFAVLLALGRPSAAVSHVSAARLWGFPVRRGQAQMVRLTDPNAWRHGTGFHMSRAPLSDGDVTTAGPIRLTSAPRTLIDCAREWELDDAVVAMDAALLTGDASRQQLEEAALAARHWPGAPRAARAVALADGRAESPLESRGRLRIVGAGITPPELQVEIRTAGRLVGVVDAWFDDAAVAVEFDGRIKYRDPWRGRSPEQVLWDEKRREDEMRSFDIRFVRITDADLFTAWARTEARLRHLLATPGPADRRFTATARQRGLRRTG